MTREEFYKLYTGCTIVHKKTGARFQILDKASPNVYSMMNTRYAFSYDYINTNTCEDYEKENGNG